MAKFAPAGAVVSLTDAADFRRYDGPGNHRTDVTEQFNGGVSHEFGGRVKIHLDDSFALSQEPTVIDPSIVTMPYRVEPGAFRNTGELDLTVGLTKDVDVYLGYENKEYFYEQNANSVVGYPFFAPASLHFPLASQDDALDRMEQLAEMELRWKVSAKTTAILGYKFRDTSYTGDGYVEYPYGPSYPYNISEGGTSFSGRLSSFRNSEAHYGYAGVEESFNPNLTGAIRAGGEFVDYERADTSRLSPYVDANLTWRFLPGREAQVGVKHLHNATDVVGIAPMPPVLDAETTAAYFSVGGKVAGNFTGSLMGQAQHSAFVGGGPNFNGKNEDFGFVELSLGCHFTSWLLAETGCNYSRLTSDLPGREYTRNFAFLGVRGTWGR
ncbi:MAG TPA: outer membrane beta-barrel protein [Verrucomicrobiae bacterium]